MAILDNLGKAMLKLFGSSSDRYVKKRADFLAKAAELESYYGTLTDAELKAKTSEFKEIINGNLEKTLDRPLRTILKEIPTLTEADRTPAKKVLAEKLKTACDGILVEAFAAVREASDRQLGIRNIFNPELEFDISTLSADMQAVYYTAKDAISNGTSVYDLELPPQLYAEVRAKYPATERPPFRFRHFDVQLIGGSVLYEGQIAEMATGEGKTLGATLAAYIVALSGRKVHVITVNDYLAQRDCDWMKPVYNALDLTVGAIQSDMDTAGDTRREMYECNITYGTNNEFGFDYLRDNMKTRYIDQVQGPLDFTIVDEVDSILIDEARTPLIISGPAQDDTNRYKKADMIAREIMKLQAPYSKVEDQISKLKMNAANAAGELSDAKKNKDKDRESAASHAIKDCQNQIEQLEGQLEGMIQYYEVEYDRHSVQLTHEGIGAAQDIAGIGSFYVGSNMEWPHLMEQALRAHNTFEKEKDYVVQDNQVIIVDEFTGRLMQGRQWSDGLHQAVEAKEGVTIKQESQTLATITLQNFFKMYQQLSGMTGTAMTEVDEFMNIYHLGVVAIPTNRPIIRDDRDDMVYKTVPEKYNAIVEEIFNVSKAGQPVLVGTTSIEKNESLSAALTKRYGLAHEVLNAKQHEREASIVTKAGQQHKSRNGEMWGNVTIATNMAGRGTDIKVPKESMDKGGLYVLGTERHEARRIDNQLRGRTGRQGDRGVSQFFLSFQDDLMRIFAPDWIVKAFERLGWEEGEPITEKRITKYVEKAQKKVEQRNFEARKSLLEYDEVMDYQRQVFYTRRQRILEGFGIEADIWEMIDDIIAERTDEILDKEYPYACISEWARNAFGLDMEIERLRNASSKSLPSLLQNHTENNAEQDIAITIGEYMQKELEEEHWDLQGLSQWARSRYDVNISASQLKGLSITDAKIKITEAALNNIRKLDFSKTMSFLEPEYAAGTLTDWVNNKFELDVKPESITNKKTDDVFDLLGQAARERYRQREVEYPVDFILSIAAHRHQQGSNYAAKEVVDWVYRKYQVIWQIEDIHSLDYDKLRDKLIGFVKSRGEGAIDLEVETLASEYGSADEAGLAKLAMILSARFNQDIKPWQITEAGSIKEFISKTADTYLREELTELERYVLLQIYDSTWKEHLYAMDHLKSGIGLRGLAERDPKMEYKREGYRMFQEMLSSIRDKVTDMIFKARLGGEEERRSVWNISSAAHDEFTMFNQQQQAAQQPQGQSQGMPKTVKNDGPRVGRNDPCPCGSGKKYKKCCGLGE